MKKMPAIYLSHGAPPLLEDATWGSELAHWSADLPAPKAILIVSAHWESAPIFITLGASTNAEVAPDTAIDGYWMGLSKRSFQVA